MIERGHQPIKSTLVKLCGKDGKKWQQYLPAVLFADRISTKQTTGYLPYKMLFGCRPVLPVDIEMFTYLGVDWWTTCFWRGQSNCCGKIGLLQRRRRASRRVVLRRLRDSLCKGELVLLYNFSLKSQWGKLFASRWNGPYCNVSQFLGSSYELEELDGTLLKWQTAAMHVKWFYARGSTDFNHTAESDDSEEEVQVPGDALSLANSDGAEETGAAPRDEDFGSEHYEKKSRNWWWYNLEYLEVTQQPRL
ncbi:hypothetical protein PTTG_06037, partial [Puccinia triticina 1-1 BBBD Race 1]